MGKIASFALLACSTALYAQTGVSNGSIRGLVKDPTGAVVAGAAVEARGLDTGFSRKATSSNDGQFELPLLPLGRYEVRVQAAGFAVYTQSGVGVELDKASQLNVALRVASEQQSITVEADASILTTNTSSISGGMNARAMENAPLPSRNTFNLALFAPGFNGRRDDEFGNPTFAFGGMQRRGFLIDGIDNSQRGGPGRMGIFSTETIAEVKVLTSSMSAEYGRTVGGMISMVTKGGSNDVHGQGMVLQRRPGLIARQPLAATKAFSQWAVYQGNIGGPVKKDKVFYFGAGEYQPLDGPRPITITPANAAALGLPASELGSAPFAQRFQTYMGRVDFQISPEDTLYIRYNNFITPSRFNTSGGLTTRSSGNNFDDRNDTFAAQWTRILGARAVNEFRIGGLQREFTRPPVSGVVGPVITITGVATLNSNDSANQYYKEMQWDFINNFSLRAGKHNYKFGADIATIGVTSGDRLSQTFQFANLAQYLNTLNKVTNPATGRPFNYTQLTQDFGDNVAQHRTGSYNFFAQDDWRITPTFTLNYGVRYEFLAYPSLPSSAPLAESRNVPNDGNNFAPRIGFAWQLTPNTVVRGGYGLFYDTTNLRLFSTVIRQNGDRVKRYVISGTDAQAPQYPSGFTGALASFAVKPSVTNFASDFRSLYSNQANVQVERALGADFSVTAGLQYFTGGHMPLLVDVNLGPPVRTLADGRPVYVNTNRPNTSFNQILQLQSIGESKYYGGFLSVQKRFSRGVQFAASYTLGHAFNHNDATSDTGVSVTDSSNLQRDWSRSSSDQRHRFVFQGVFQPVFQLSNTWDKVLNGFMIAPNYTITSAFPVNVVQGTDLNGDSVNNDRPLFRGRNDSPGYGFKEMNLRISRTFPVWERFKIEVIAEAENLFNSLNASCGAGGCSGSVVNRFDAADFRRITGTVNSRQIQLGGRLRF